MIHPFVHRRRPSRFGSRLRKRALFVDLPLNFGDYIDMTRTERMIMNHDLQRMYLNQLLNAINKCGSNDIIMLMVLGEQGTFSITEPTVDLIEVSKSVHALFQPFGQGSFCAFRIGFIQEMQLKRQVLIVNQITAWSSRAPSIHRERAASATFPYTLRMSNTMDVSDVIITQNLS